MKQLLKYVDVCIGNEEEVQTILWISIKNDLENIDLNIDEYKHIAEIIEEDYGCKYVAFTLRESFSASRNGWSVVLYNNGRLFASKKYDI